MSFSWYSRAAGSSSIVAYPYRARGMFASIEICHTQHHRAKLSPRQRLLLQDPVTKCQPVFKMIVKPYSNLPCPYWALKGECHALELLKIGSTNCYSIRKKCCHLEFPTMRVWSIKFYSSWSIMFAIRLDLLVEGMPRLHLEYPTSVWSINRYSN